MKKSQDFGQTFASGAKEVVETLEQAARLIDAEWQRLVSSIEESDTVPEQVREAVGRFDSVVDSMRCRLDDPVEEEPPREEPVQEEPAQGQPAGFADELDRALNDTRKFVNDLVPAVADVANRAAQQLGVALPDEWPWNTAENDVRPPPSPTAADSVKGAPEADKSKGAKSKGAKSKGAKSKGAKSKSKTASKAKKKAPAKAKTKAASKKTASQKTASKKTAAKKASAKKTATKKASAKKKR